MKKSKKYLEKGGKMEEIKDLWKKVGLISYLTKKFNQIKAQFGKTAMMKYLYILQEVYNVQLGYDFSLTYCNVHKHGLLLLPNLQYNHFRLHMLQKYFRL